MATPPPLPTRPPGGTMRGRSERMSTLPERELRDISDRRRGLEDEHELEEDARLGTWYQVMSTWLSRVRASYVPVRGGPPTPPAKDPKQRLVYIQIEFLSGATVEYNNPEPYSTFDDLVNSSSKGQYVHHASTHLYGKPYTLLSPATRRVTAEMRRLRSPQSRGRGQRLIGAKRQPPPLPRSVGIA